MKKILVKEIVVIPDDWDCPFFDHEGDAYCHNNDGPEFCNDKTCPLRTANYLIKLEAEHD